MNYYDSNGHVGQGPTTTGLDALQTWGGRQSETISEFLNAGATDDPEELRASLEATTTEDDPDLEDMRQALLGAATKARDVLIVSD